MSNAEALFLPTPIGPRALLGVEALLSERHPAAVYPAPSAPVLVEPCGSPSASSLAFSQEVGRT